MTTKFQGYLEIYFGPMTSGKTLKIVLAGTQASQLGYKVLYINHSSDVRLTVGGDAKSFSSHCESMKSMTDKIDVTSASKLEDVNVDEYDVVCVDEGQFYPDIYPVVKKWVNEKGKHVLIAALDGTSERKLFGDVYRLLPECDSFVKVTAECKLCNDENLANPERKRPIVSQPAPFTLRLVDSKEEVLIGGTDIYSAVCRYHHAK